MKVEIGKRITEIRKSMNLNKEQFAKLIGMSGQYLGTVEKGINGLSLDKLVTICKKANISADYILFGKQSINNSHFTDKFSSLDDRQISHAFKILEELALFINEENDSYSSYNIKF